MCNTPEKEQYGSTAGKSTHGIHGIGSSIAIIAKKNNEKTAQEYKQWGAGRVGHTQFIGTSYKLATVPQTTSCFPCEKINKKSNGKHGPAGNVIRFSEIHKMMIFSAKGGWQK